MSNTSLSSKPERVFWGELLCYVVLSVAVLGILWFGLGLATRNLEVPMAFYNDCLHHALIANAIAENGWWWHVPNLSAPFGLDMILFPVGGNVDYALMKGIACFTKSPGVILNVTWILTVLLTSWSSFWSLRRLQGRTDVAWVFALLFAFFPHVFYRNVGHLMLTIYLIPPIAMAAIRLASGTFQELPRFDHWVIALFSISLGFNYIYTSFFACFVLAVACLTSSLCRDLRSASRSALLIVLIISATGLSLSPTLLRWARDPVAKANIDSSKGFADMDVYSLNLRQLFYPTMTNPIPCLRNLNRTFFQDALPLDSTESHAARLGTVGAVGLLLLLGVMVTRTARSDRIWLAHPLLGSVAGLTIACLLFATTGGLGSLFNFFAGGDIRCYNRISPFIGFFAFVAVAVSLERLCEACSGDFRTWLVWPGMLSLLVFGVIDQASWTNVNGSEEHAAQFEELKQLVRQIEATLPEESMIYQLPHYRYPGYSPFLAIDQLKPHLFSRHLRWSWPVLSGQAIHMHTRLGRLLQKNRTSEALNCLVFLGFKGVWLDRSKLDGQAELYQTLTTNCRCTPIVSSSKRYVFFNLKAVADQLRETVTSTEWEIRRAELVGVQPNRYQLGKSIDFSLGGDSDFFIESLNGWSEPEEHGRWTVGNKVGLSLMLNQVPTTDLLLTVDASSFTGLFKPSLTVHVKVNDQLFETWTYPCCPGQPDLGRRTTRLPRELLDLNGQLRLTFEVIDPVSRQAIGVGGDRRRLGLFFKEVVIDQYRVEVGVAPGPLPPEGFRARLELLGAPVVIVAGASIPVVLRAANEGNTTWPVVGLKDDTYRVSVAYRWLTMDGKEVTSFDNRQWPKQDVAPSTTTDVKVQLKTPRELGRYILEFDMVQDRVAWFSQKGSPPLRTEIDIVPQP